MVIWVIAKNSFRELMRDRVMYALLGFAILFLALSLAVGQLTYTEKEKISISLGLASVQICLSLLTIFIGASLVYREINKKTIYTIFVRPLSRTQFLIGKFLGFALVILTLLLGFIAIYVAINYMLEIPPTKPLLIAFGGIYLEMLLLILMSFFFISFSQPLIAVVFSICFFLIGHWSNNLKYFVDRSESDHFRFLGKFIMNVTPQLEAFNWRELAVKKEILSTVDFEIALLHFFSWSFLFLGFACFIFEKRDFD